VKPACLLWVTDFIGSITRNDKIPASLPHDLLSYLQSMKRAPVVCTQAKWIIRYQKSLVVRYAESEEAMRSLSSINLLICCRSPISKAPQRVKLPFSLPHGLVTDLQSKTGLLSRLKLSGSQARRKGLIGKVVWDAESEGVCGLADLAETVTTSPEVAIQRYWRPLTSSSSMTPWTRTAPS